MSGKRKTVIIAVLIGFGIWLVVYGGGVLKNAKMVQAVRLKTIPGAVEKRDHIIPGFDKSGGLPDYQLMMRTSKRWREIGLVLNTSAKDGIDFPLPEPVPFFQLKRLRVVEKDAIEDDILEEVSVHGGVIQGNAYTFAIEAKFDLSAGMTWFFEETFAGKAIAAVLMLTLIFIFITGM